VQKEAFALVLRWWASFKDRVMPRRAREGEGSDLGGGLKTSCIITCPLLCIFDREPPLTVACRSLAIHDKVLEGRHAGLKHDHLHSKLRHKVVRDEEEEEEEEEERLGGARLGLSRGK